MSDVSVQLIEEKAGYGLARAAWLRTLEYIRQLPTVGDSSAK